MAKEQLSVWRWHDCAASETSERNIESNNDSNQSVIGGGIRRNSINNHHHGKRHLASAAWLAATIIEK